MKQNWRLYQNYIIIAILSFISVFFLPMLGTSIGIGFNIPNTPAGWIVWTLTKLCIVIVNILIFDQFVKQAKVNVRDNEQFIKAEEILNNIKEEAEDIKPAKEYIGVLYKKKGITLCITTILSIFGLTNAILSFDWVSMLTYIFTIIMALVFGWITMNEVEDIWTDKHYKYALKVQKEIELKKEEKRIEEEKLQQQLLLEQEMKNTVKETPPEPEVIQHTQEDKSYTAPNKTLNYLRSVNNSRNQNFNSIIMRDMYRKKGD